MTHAEIQAFLQLTVDRDDYSPWPGQWLDEGVVPLFPAMRPTIRPAPFLLAFDLDDLASVEVGCTYHIAVTVFLPRRYGNGRYSPKEVEQRRVAVCATVQQVLFGTDLALFNLEPE